MSDYNELPSRLEDYGRTEWPRAGPRITKDYWGTPVADYKELVSRLLRVEGLGRAERPTAGPRTAITPGDQQRRNTQAALLLQQKTKLPLSRGSATHLIDIRNPVLGSGNVHAFPQNEAQRREPQRHGLGTGVEKHQDHRVLRQGRDKPGSRARASGHKTEGNTRGDGVSCEG